MRHSKTWMLVYLLSGLLYAGASNPSFLKMNSGLFRGHPNTFSIQDNFLSTEIVLDLRGGETRRRQRKKSRGRTATLSSQRTATGKKKAGASKGDEEKTTALMKKYNEILPLTRIYFVLVGIVTLLGLVMGEEMAQGLFSLDPVRVFYGWEVWRIITAATFLGKISVSWVINGYYVLQYGTTLERDHGTAQHLVFLFTQMTILTAMNALLAQPFFTSSLITSMLHVLSRKDPKRKAKWLLFKVDYWLLPYGLMLVDVLQAASPAAILPHILGIMSGHFYFFHKFVWPKTGGQDWLQAPDFLVQKLDQNEKTEAKDTVNKALKTRKRGKGRKLGSK